MKKLFLLASLISAAAYGASIDHIQTYSPDYLANQAQTGMINATSANYNPAGLAQLEKGKYVHAGVQFATGHEIMQYNGKTHKAKLKQAIPNLALYSVDEKGATFFTFGGIAGGGKLKYNGAAGVDVALQEKSTDPFIAALNVYDKGTQVQGSNKYEQITLGRTFKVDEKLSFSVAGRLVHGTRKLAGDLRLGIKPNGERLKELGKMQADSEIAKLDAKTLNPDEIAMKTQEIINKINLKSGEQLKVLQIIGRDGLNGNIGSTREAWGYGLQLGVNYKYSEKLNLAARYDFRVKLDFKAKGNENKILLSKLGRPDLGFTNFYPQYMPNTKTRRDLPAILALGASYQATDKWLVSAAGNFYFNRQAKMDRIPGHTADYKNGWELALGSEYKLNDKFTLLGSVNYAKTGAKRSSYNDTEYALDSTTLGAGVRYNYDETLSFTTSVAHFMYDTAEGTFKEKYSPVVKENQKYKKSITAIGLSVTKKF